MEYTTPPETNKFSSNPKSYSKKTIKQFNQFNPVKTTLNFSMF
jgi:hypothetical protein